MVDFLKSDSASCLERLLVVAPHPDDDVLACGGTIARAWAAGAALRILYVTDGAASHTGSKTFPAARLRAVREAEAAEGLAILGLPAAQAHFLREPDTGLAHSGPAAEVLAARIAAHLREFAPTIVLSPWIRDAHGDHIAAATAVRRALALSGSPAELYEYTVWLDDLGTSSDMPLPHEIEACAVDVSAFRKRKALAIAAHRSQLGQLIDDAEEAFTLPELLLRRADADSERFFRILPRGRATA